MTTTSRGNKTALYGTSIHDCYSDNNITWKQGRLVRYFHTRLLFWQQHHVETRQLCTVLPYTTAILTTTSRENMAALYGTSIHGCYSDNNITWKQGSFVRYFHTRLLFWQQHHVETRQLCTVLPYTTAILTTTSRGNKAALHGTSIHDCYSDNNITWKQGRLVRYFHTRLLFWQQHHVETRQLCTVLPYTTAIMTTTSRGNKTALYGTSIHVCYSDNNITWKQDSFVRYFHTRLLFWQQHHVETRQLSTLLPYTTAILTTTSRGNKAA